MMRLLHFATFRHRKKKRELTIFPTNEDTKFHSNFWYVYAGTIKGTRNLLGPIGNNYNKT